MFIMNLVIFVFVCPAIVFFGELKIEPTPIRPGQECKNGST